MKKLTLKKLNRFTNPADLRDFCRVPHQIGAFTYATNGHVIVRVDAAVLPAEVHPDAALSIKLERVLAKPSPDAVWRAVTPLDRADAVHHEVKSFKGKKEKVESFYTVLIGEAHIQLRYWNLIADLPGAEIAEVDNCFAPVPFRFTGGVGTVMPCKT